MKGLLGVWLQTQHLFWPRQHSGWVAQGGEGKRQEGVVAIWRLTLTPGQKYSLFCIVTNSDCS